MSKVKTWAVLASALAGLILVPANSRAEDKTKDASPTGPVSYVQQIRPIFQANCQGCHQPAKAGGDYVMTAFDRLLKGGESGVEAVVPGKPGESHLIDQIRPSDDGKALMPKDKPALSQVEIELVQRWISEGAKDDTPENAVARFDQDHPPVYTRPPVIPAVAFSPDGQYLAVAGFHEVLLWKADGSERVARL
ncbi:MAG TPA: c-type cytochrome domain-containing protein, partial [Isosphaeraceae bacterium]|nr:c-type cytochrome domain-containing protein [Isosphaeraceae bacterium]